MKKKLKISQIQVKSFVTEVEPAKIQGGGTETMYSCLDYVTCDAVRCYLTTQGPVCIGPA